MNRTDPETGRWRVREQADAGLRKQLDWGSIAPLALRARAVADGAYTGVHRSARKGAGVEFGGHRNYLPGDDLRWLDRHALMRHGRLVVRQFETETERHVHLVLDATASMGYRSEQGPAAKLAYAALLAAALSYVATRERDPVGLSWIGGSDVHTLPARAGSDAFDRIVTTLERAQAWGDDGSGVAGWQQALRPLGERAPRGSVVVVFSDLLDVPLEAADELARVATRSRKVVLVRVLDPFEAEFPFEGPLRLRATEGEQLVETEGSRARRGYLEALENIATEWSQRLLPRDGALVRLVTREDPVRNLRRLLGVIGGSVSEGS